jgi:S-(hydroxymethyl)glutathione dehydrogenase/alcohol dehydrogenase
MMLAMGRMPWNRGDGSKLMGAIGGLGTFAEEAVVHEGALVKSPDHFPMEEAALVGCSVTTGLGSALLAAKVTPGSTCAVIGVGGVGQTVIQGCRIAKAANIVAIDLNESKRKAAEKHGATHSIDPRETDPAEFLKSLTNGRGADFAFEVVGVPALQRQAYDMTRPGGSVVWVGVSGMTSETGLPGAMLTLDNKRVIGTIYGSANPREDFVKFLNFSKSGDFDLKGMVSQKITINDINDAFTAMLEGDVIRSVVIY